MMNFEVRAVTPEDFDSYIRFRQSNPQATNAERSRRSVRRRKPSPRFRSTPVASPTVR